MALCCRYSANLVVKCQKCCNPHGGVCHLAPNCEGSSGNVVVLALDLVCYPPAGRNAIIDGRLGAQSAAHMATCCTVLLQYCNRTLCTFTETIQFMTSVFVHISVRSCVWMGAGYLWCILPCVHCRAFSLVFESHLVSTRRFLPLKMNFPLLY